MQVSATSQVPADARHTVLLLRKPLPGQLALLPVQVSATSQSPAEGRQTVLPLRKLSRGQPALLPVQLSATSQDPAEGRHTRAAEAKASPGQAGPLPVQVSATSQGPAAPRQTKAPLRKTSPGHAALPPEQVSATSQGPFEGRHTVLPERKESSGHTALLPEHISGASQGPAAARQTLPLWNESLGHIVEDPVQTSGASQSPAAGRHMVPAAAGPTGTHCGAPLSQRISPRSQGLPVEQLAPGVHPEAQLPAPSQKPAPQDSPTATKASAGQAGASPEQVSATSHSPAAARHSTAAPAKPLAGHIVDEPSQVSCTSQGPSDSRQTVVAGAGPAATHSGAPLLQSITPSSQRLGRLQLAPGVHPEAQPPAPSQKPSSQASPASTTSLFGHARPVPSQTSSMSHWPRDARHTVPAAMASPVPAQTGVSPEQSQAPTSQLSSSSQGVPHSLPASGIITPASAGIEASAPGTALQPSSGEQNWPSSQASSRPSRKQVPRTQTDWAQGSELASQSEFSAQVDTPTQASGFSGEHSGGTQTASRQASFSPQRTPAQFRVMTTVVLVTPVTRTR